MGVWREKSDALSNIDVALWGELGSCGFMSASVTHGRMESGYHMFIREVLGHIAHVAAPLRFPC